MAPPSSTPRRRRALAPLAAVLLAVAATVAACGDGGSTAGAPKITDPAAKRGQQLAKDSGCQSCHSTNGKNGTGPTWTDLAGSQVELDGGETVTADDAYLARAITDPKAEVVDGYPSIMPQAYEFTDEQVDDLVAYLRALSTNTPAADAPADDAPADGSSTTAGG